MGWTCPHKRRLRPSAVAAALHAVAAAVGAGAQHAQHLPYFDTNLIVMEAENFTTSTSIALDAASGSWEAKEWMVSNNRFAASVADTYLSRRAYLQATAEMSCGVAATMAFSIDAAEAGEYQALLRCDALWVAVSWTLPAFPAQWSGFSSPWFCNLCTIAPHAPPPIPPRYEAAYQFETPVSLTVAEKTGKVIFNRTYGQRHSLKVSPSARPLPQCPHLARGEGGGEREGRRRRAGLICRLWLVRVPDWLTVPWAGVRRSIHSQPPGSDHT